MTQQATTDSFLPYFSMSLGFIGLGAAFRRFGVDVELFSLLSIMGVLLFLLVVGSLPREMRDARIDLYNEDAHALCFFSAAFMSVEALIGPAGDVLTSSAPVVWLVAVGLHMTLAVLVIWRWIGQGFALTSIAPLWFLPTAGLLLAPQSGATLGLGNIAEIVFWVGLFLWIAVFVGIVAKIANGATIADSVRPTYFIFAAPPFLALSSALALGIGDAAVLNALFWFGVVVVTASFALAAKSLRADYTPSLWAFTFPSAAFASGTIEFGDNVIGPGSEHYAVFAISFAAILFVIVLVRFFGAAFQERMRLL
jgi:tellurite resistance protein